MDTGSYKNLRPGRVCCRTSNTPTERLDITVLVEGGKPIEDSDKIKVRSEEVLTLYMRHEDGNNDSEDNGGSDSSSSSEQTNDDTSSYDPFGFGHSSDSPPGPNNDNGPPRGPPPPMPINRSPRRSRSPRRRCILHLADQLPGRCFDIIATLCSGHTHWITL